VARSSPSGTAFFFLADRSDRHASRAGTASVFAAGAASSVAACDAGSSPGSESPGFSNLRFMAARLAGESRAFFLPADMMIREAVIGAVPSSRRRPVVAGRYSQRGTTHTQSCEQAFSYFISRLTLSSRAPSQRPPSLLQTEHGCLERGSRYLVTRVCQFSCSG